LHLISTAHGEIFQGGGRKKKMTEVTYICCSAKKSSTILFVLSFFLTRFFGRFVTRGKKNMGSPHKMVRLFFIRVFGRFVTKTREANNRAKISSAPKKSSYLLTPHGP
jgi:hypothetical protein